MSEPTLTVNSEEDDAYDDGFNIQCDSTVKPGRAGSFSYDLHQEKYNKQWLSHMAFDVWLSNVLRAKTIEFIKSQMINKPGFSYIQYVCSHNRTGGKCNYMKKHPDWTQKVASKHICIFSCCAH
jgi:hypothetical protein